MSRYKTKQKIAFFCLILSSLFTYLLPYAMMKIIDHITRSSDMKIVLLYIIVYLLVAVLCNILILISNYNFLRIGRKFSTELKLKLCRHIVSLDGKYYVNVKSGELLTVIEDDVEKIQSMFGKTMPTFGADILTSIPIIIFAFGVEKRLVIMFFIVMPIVYFVQKYYIKKIYLSYKTCRKSISENHSVLQEFVSQLLDIIALDADRYFFAKINSRLLDVENKHVKHGMICYMRSFYFSVFSVIMAVIILSIGGYGVIQSTITIGALIALVSNYSKIMTPFIRVSDFLSSYQECKVSLRRVNSILEISCSKNKAVEYVGTVRMVSFHHVTFSYDKLKKVLQEVTLKFEYGKVTALVGESGSGKTTIVNLLLRLWNPQEGVICINDKEINCISRESIREMVSVVSQNTVLFNDTIYNNICLYDESISKEQVIKVCKECGIDDYINELPDGLDTVIGERGVKLSGGQKQRIEIVRALIRNRPIIVFDEATSALDNNTESIIKEAIEKLKGTHIIILIAHRLSTVENADTIYVLDNGRIVESGAHKHLISLNGKYAELYMKTHGNKR